MNKRIIAVLGATGAQGGGLVQAILADPDHDFAVRAITHQPDSDKAKALAALGVEVVGADLNDVESLKRAFAGAYGVFGVTDFWGLYFADAKTSAAKEQAQAHNIAEAAGTAGVQHVIWSTLEDTRKLPGATDGRMPMLQGDYLVPHFDAKHVANSFFIGLPGVTYLNTSFYFGNFSTFFVPQKSQEGDEYVLTLPMGEAVHLACMHAADIGKCALNIFRDGDLTFGRTFGVVSERLLMSQICQIMTEELGVVVKYNPVTPDVFRSFGFPGADECGNMFQIFVDFEEQVQAARRLFKNSTGFRDWVRANKATMLAAMKVPETAAVA